MPTLSFDHKNSSQCACAAFITALLSIRHVHGGAKSRNHIEPVSATDMRPPCIGYLDNNRRWNSITNIDCPSNNGLQVRHNSLQSSFQPLERAPRKLEHLGIEWTPRTSIGVREWLVDANGQLL